MASSIDSSNDERTLHVLTPAARTSPDALTAQPAVKAGDLIADLQGFPASAWLVEEDGACHNLTPALGLPGDYWTVARHWFKRVTAATGLQDALAVEGYGFWWTLNGQRFVPGLQDWGNTFAWIDLLQTLRQQHNVRRLTLIGEHPIITHIVLEIFPEVAPAESERPLSVPARGRSPLHVTLIVSRLLFGLIYLLLSFLRRPHICLLSSTNLLRPVSANGKQQLRDIYLGEIEGKLRHNGHRVTLLEKYGSNATWAGLRARGFFFPTDIVFLLAAPLWQRLGAFPRLRARWRRRWQEIRPKLAPHLHYREIDLAPLLLPLIRKEFIVHAPNLSIMVAVWRRILRRWRPALIYANNSYGRASAPVVIAARSLGIETVEQQHGMIGRNHIAYLVPRDLPRRTRFPLCDRMVLWGDYTQRFLVRHGVYEPPALFVGGFPRIDALLGELPPAAQTRAKLQIPATALIVLYTSNEFAHPFTPKLVDSIARFPAEGDVHWIVKLHPREETRSDWERMLDERELENVHVVQNEIDFYALLAACDIHVGFASTTIIEAAVLGKVNLGLEVEGMVNPAGYGQAGGYRPVRPDTVGETVQSLVENPDQTDALLQQQKQFAEDWCLHDGRSVSRIVSFLERLYAGEVSGRPHLQEESA